MPQTQTIMEGIAEALHRLGYREGMPPWASRGVEVDRQIAAAAECAGCGRAGLDLRTFYRQPRSYKGYAACADCGHADEL